MVYRWLEDTSSPALSPFRCRTTTPQSSTAPRGHGPPQRGGEDAETAHGRRRCLPPPRHRPRPPLRRSRYPHRPLPATLVRRPHRAQQPRAATEPSPIKPSPPPSPFTSTQSPLHPQPSMKPSGAPQPATHLDHQRHFDTRRPIHRSYFTILDLASLHHLALPCQTHSIKPLPAAHTTDYRVHIPPNTITHTKSIPSHASIDNSTKATQCSAHCPHCTPFLPPSIPLHPSTNTCHHVGLPTRRLPVLLRKHPRT